ncbi:hypothetical protein, partial [Phytoactinopolyspora endophytica]|uniref:hypothetical protein n=1 Tax=Phytoactinopolyspora endophytica TaxID=1642495 RepID=UPI00197C994B
MRWLGGRWRRIAVVVVLLLFLLIEGRVFVFPPADSVTRADAIVVFDGPGDRNAHAWDLAENEHVAPIVVISIDDTGKCEPWKRDLEEYCLTPDPATTRGESRAFAKLASERGWDQLIVVSTASQSVRARLRLGRCYDGDMEFVTVRENGVFEQVSRVIYENGAMLKALLFERDC